MGQPPRSGYIKVFKDSAFKILRHTISTSSSLKVNELQNPNLEWPVWWRFASSPTCCCTLENYCTFPLLARKKKLFRIFLYVINQACNNMETNKKNTSYTMAVLKPLLANCNWHVFEAGWLTQQIAWPITLVIRLLLF